MPEAALEDLEKEIDHSFHNKSLLEEALMHSSTGEAKSYERLEFLGDRVLGLIVAQLLFEKFSHETEGDLAKRLSALVQGSFLTKIALEMNLGAYISFSQAEKQAGGAQNENILADVFESVIGALYLDGGLEQCHKLIERLWRDSFHEMKTPPLHPKTAVQEWAQGEGLTLPDYKIVKQSGPDHMPLFDVCLKVEGFTDIVAQGRSRQDAEKKAAKTFLQQLENKKP